MVDEDYNCEQNKSANKYYCETCDHYSYRKYNFERHLLSSKHKKFKHDYKIEYIGVKGASQKIFIKKNQNFDCECGKKYKHQTNLIRHKKINCKLNNTKIIENNELIKKCENNELIEKCENNELIEKKENEINYKEMLMTLINENKEMRKTISELVPKVGNNNNTVTNNITNNANFNLNIFLNEKCKDALNIDEFINNIEVSVSNLLLTKDKGLIDGISNIFIENMNKLSIYERPVHCTDLKRETLYIKQDEWKKDTDNSLVKDAIKKISQLQVKNIKKWTDVNPGHLSKRDKQEEFLKLVKTTVGEIDDKQNKIIKNICKNVYINEKIIKEIDNE